MTPEERRAALIAEARRRGLPAPGETFAQGMTQSPVTEDIFAPVSVQDRMGRARGAQRQAEIDAAVAERVGRIPRVAGVPMPMMDAPTDPNQSFATLKGSMGDMVRGFRDAGEAVGGALSQERREFDPWMDAPGPFAPVRRAAVGAARAIGDGAQWVIDNPEAVTSGALNLVRGATFGPFADYDDQVANETALRTEREIRARDAEARTGIPSLTGQSSEEYQALKDASGNAFWSATAPLTVLDGVALAGGLRGVRGARGAGGALDDVFSPAAPRPDEAPVGSIADELLRLGPQIPGESPGITAYRRMLEDERMAEIAAENAAKTPPATVGFGHANTLAARRALDEATLRNGGEIAPPRPEPPPFTPVPVRPTAPRYGEDALQNPIPVTPPARIDPINQMRFRASDTPDRGALFPQEGAPFTPVERPGNAPQGAPFTSVRSGAPGDPFGDRAWLDGRRVASAEASPAPEKWGSFDPEHLDYVRRSRGIPDATDEEVAWLIETGADALPPRLPPPPPPPAPRPGDAYVSQSANGNWRVYNPRTQNIQRYTSEEEARRVADELSSMRPEIGAGRVGSLDAPLRQGNAARGAPFNPVEASAANDRSLQSRFTPEPRNLPRNPLEGGAPISMARANDTPLLPEVIDGGGALSAPRPPGELSVFSPARTPYDGVPFPPGAASDAADRMNYVRSIVDEVGEDGALEYFNAMSKFGDADDPFAAVNRADIEAVRSGAYRNPTSNVQTVRPRNMGSVPGDDGIFAPAAGPRAQAAPSRADADLDARILAARQTKSLRQVADEMGVSVGRIQGAERRAAQSVQSPRQGVEVGNASGTSAQPRLPRDEAQRRDARIMELIKELQPVRNTQRSGGWKGKDNSYRVISERLQAEGFANVTPSVISGVVKRKGASAPQAAQSIDEAAGALGISPDRYRALSARSKPSDPFSPAMAGLGTAATAGAIGLGVTDEAEAQESPAVDDARTRVSELEADDRYFASVGTDPAKVREAQQRLILNGYNVAVDGRPGGETAAAISAYRRDLRAELDTARTRLRELEEQQAERSTRASPFVETLRTAAPFIGLAGGIASGYLTRGGSVRAASRQLKNRNAEIDAILTRGRGTPARVANINEYWRRGGAGERVPFDAAKTAQGFKVRPQAASASSLFEPAPRYFRSTDYAVTGGALAEAGVSTVFLEDAKREMEAAQAAVDKNPTEANRVRLEQAKNMYAAWEAVQRAGLGLAAGRAGAAFKNPYPTARPDVAAAERERILLTRALARKPQKKPKPKS